MNKKRGSRARKSGAAVQRKKTKFFSLRHQFPADEIKSSDGMAAIVHERQAAEDGEAQDTENVAIYFEEGDGGDATLNGLLNGSGSVESISSHANSNSSRVVGDFSLATASLSSYSYRKERAALVRTAIRNRERDSRGEKWVRYSEVVERKVKEEEVSSSSVDVIQRRRPKEAEKGTRGGGGPLLKLDYDEILNAWSNKGPLYIDCESSQIVPDINHDNMFSHEASNISQLHDYKNYQGLSFGCSVGFWTVPDLRRNNDVEDDLKVCQREASVLRYKEKRQNRLFCKKIRYQVRKLNAEKRPRLKGRFVKKS